MVVNGMRKPVAAIASAWKRSAMSWLMVAPP